jgi:hypothetical protein
MIEREGYGTAVTNQPQDVAYRTKGKPEGTEWFAIRLMGHKRGSGDSSPRDMDKGYDQGNMPMAWTRGKRQLRRPPSLSPLASLDAS